MNDYCVYVHKRPDGSPFYVGKGKIPRARKIVRPYNRHHFNIVSKHGKENIDVHIAKENLSEPDAFSYEMQLIACLREFDFRLCNKSDGGEGPSNPSAETRRRMSESQSKRKHSPESREKMRLAQLGRKHPESVKEKIGYANKGKIVPQSTREKIRAANIGKKYPMEVREKVSQSLKGNSRARGNKFSEELKAQLSAKRKGKPWTEARRLAYDLRWGSKSGVKK